MITQEESGLTQSAYSAIQTTKGLPTFRFTLEQHSPYWEEHSEGDGNDDANFDAIVVDDEIWRAYYKTSTIVIEHLPNEDSGDQSWTTITTLSNIDECQPSLVYDDANDIVYLFYHDSDQVVYRENSTVGDRETWNTGSQITIFDFPSSEGLKIAATNHSTLHVAQEREDYNTRLFKFNAVGVSSSTMVSSDIYWPHTFDSFDGENLDDIDYLVFSSRYPADIGVRVEGSTVQTLAYANYGVGSFRVQNNNWSDLSTIELVDAYDAFRFRKYPKLSKTGDRLCCNVAGREGSAGHAHDAYMYYLTKDGINWSQPQLAPNGDSISTAKILQVNDNYVYTVGGKYTQRAKATRMFGVEPHEDLTIDLTPYVQGYKEGSLKLHWEDDWYDNSILAEDRVFRVYFDVGYYVSGNAEMIQVDVFEVDSIQTDKQVQGNKYVYDATIKMRGLIANLTDRVKASSVVENSTQQVGHDQYTDTTGQDAGYGGLHHTAIVSGAFQSDSPTLVLDTNNRIGIAWSTMVLDAQNASIRAATGWPEIEVDWPDTRFAGLIVRGYDKDNFYYASYYPEDGSIKLIGISGGNATILESLGSVGTPGDTGGYIGLWVIAHFSRIVVYYKTLSDYDPIGSGWTEAFEYIMPGSETTTNDSFQTIESVPLEKGYVGYAGYAYEPDPEYPDYSFNIDPINLEPFSWDFPWVDPSSWWLPQNQTLLPGIPSTITKLALIGSDWRVHQTANFTTPSASGGPNYTTKTPTGTYSGTVYNFVVDAYSPRYRGTGTSLDGWIATASGIYKITDLLGSPVATLQHTFSNTHGGAVNIDFSISSQGWGVCTYNKQNSGVWCTYTRDGGTTWSTDAKISNYYLTSDPQDIIVPGIAMDQHNAGTVYAGAYIQTGSAGSGTLAMGGLFKSTDYGATWSPSSDYNVNFYQGLGFDMHIPYADSTKMFYGRTNLYFWKWAMQFHAATSGGDTNLTDTAGGPILARNGVVSCPQDANYMAVMDRPHAGTGDATSKCRLYVSTDAGVNWTLRKEYGIFSTHRVAISGDDKNVLFNWGGVVEYSDDFGVTIDDRSGGIFGAPTYAGYIVGIAGAA